ncbi:MAG: hypothetical protein LW768_19405 [Rubrivivax sp.]|jgi:hypothetical protein|nr:hypothetical protein [Rubrivivax sp.]
MLHTSEYTFTAPGGTSVVQEVPDGTVWSAQMTATATGAVTAAAVLEVTNTPANAASWRTLATFNLAGSPSANDSAVFTAAWKAYRWRGTGLTGTGAAASCAVCVGA